MNVGCQRDKAGNRTLHFDQYCLLVLLFFFNPVVRSLRAIEQASQLRKVQRKLGCLRASLGTLSEAIVLDAIVCLGDYEGAKDRPDHPLRLVIVKTTPYEKRGGPASDGLLLVATNLLDLPAWVIALIYRYRWTIEIFFRFFKQVLGCRHLLSHDPVGVEIQTYCAIIACMLISLWTGRKPTLRTYEMICHYFTGLAEEDELLAHLAKLQRQDARS